MKQLIVFFLLLRMIVIPFSIKKEPETEHSEVPAAILQQLQEQFPAGKYWNHIGSRYNNPDGWTDTACWSPRTRIIWKTFWSRSSRFLPGSGASRPFLKRLRGIRDKNWHIILHVLSNSGN